ncbi:class E sortase [Streptomyces pathocidini]|uniref:Class E sortase n=1 Tax=Streptomyces pathocidini TaxID=1650571 RepID=A0ABW7UTU8_9ACTN
MRERVPVVRDRRPRRVLVARGLWGAAEAAVTVGLVLLLLVVHQLWWTNRQARAGADRQVEALERAWGGQADAAPSTPPEEAPADGSADEADGSADESAADAAEGGQAGGDTGTGGSDRSAQPAAPSWDQAYAVLRIPRLGVIAPVAQGISKSGVLNRGYVGHYPRTAQPGQAGNFALAGHRNTHGEPFRYINRLRNGDELRVETHDGVFTYRVERTLPQTSAIDTTVIAGIPRSTARPGYGFTQPGYYITLTTCTPEYTSKYRLVVWGKLKSIEKRGTRG